MTGHDLPDSGPAMAIPMINPEFQSRFSLEPYALSLVPLYNQHGIPIAIKPIFPLNGVPVSRFYQFQTGKSSSKEEK